MLKFVVRRILWTIPVILLVILFTFVMMRQIKGNPFRKTERAVPASIQANLERKFHLDQPWYEQYAYYVKGVFTWDLGPSLVLRNQTVNDIISEHFPVSAELGVLAFLSRSSSVSRSGSCQRSRRTRPGTTSRCSSRASASPCPSFLVATLLIYYFAAKWGHVSGLPTSGWDTWQSKVLPVITLSLTPMAYFARLVRGSMLETLQQDYVRTATREGAAPAPRSSACTCCATR